MMLSILTQAEDVSAKAETFEISPAGRGWFLTGRPTRLSGYGFLQVVELKTDAELSLKLQEDHHRITEAEIKKDLKQQLHSPETG